MPFNPSANQIDMPVTASQIMIPPVKKLASRLSLISRRSDYDKRNKVLARINDMIDRDGHRDKPPITLPRVSILDSELSAPQPAQHVQTAGERLRERARAEGKIGAELSNPHLNVFVESWDERKERRAKPVATCKIEMPDPAQPYQRANGSPGVWGKGRVRKHCATCNKPFDATADGNRVPKKYCSKRCKNIGGNRRRAARLGARAYTVRATNEFAKKEFAKKNREPRQSGGIV